MSIWLWRWVYFALYLLGSAVVYAVWTEQGTESEPTGLAEVGAPLLALCAALTAISNTVNANKEAKIPLQDFAPGMFAVLSAYFWIASTQYINRHPSDWGLIGSFALLLIFLASAALIPILVYLLLQFISRWIKS